MELNFLVHQVIYGSVYNRLHGTIATPATACIGCHADHHAFSDCAHIGRLSLCATIANPRVGVKAINDPSMDQ